MNPWLPIIAAAVPEVAALIRAVAALRKKYPAVTPEELAAAVVSITGLADAAFDDVLAQIAADQATHPVK